MPKILIEFNLPEEKEEYEVYSKAMDMHSALWEYSQDVLRKLDKYGYHPSGRELTEEEAKIVGLIREEFYRILGEYGVDL
jgi:hypothetical protein